MRSTSCVVTLPDFDIAPRKTVIYIFMSLDDFRYSPNICIKKLETVERIFTKLMTEKYAWESSQQLKSYLLAE